MLCAHTVRRLKPGSFDEFAATFPDEPPAGWVRFHALRGIDDPDEVVTFGFFDGTLEELERSQEERGYRELRDAIDAARRGGRRQRGLRGRGAWNRQEVAGECRAAEDGPRAAPACSRCGGRRHALLERLRAGDGSLQRWSATRRRLRRVARTFVRTDSAADESCRRRGWA